MFILLITHYILVARTADPALNAKRRDQIVDATIRCVIKKGLHQSSMQDICAEAKLSAGAVYNYFDSKQVIIEAIAARDKAENAEVIIALQNCDDFIPRIQLIISEILKYFSNPSHGRLGVEIAAEASRNPAVAKLFSNNELELKKALVDALRSAKRNKQIDPNIKPEIAAEVLLILIDGMSSRAILDPDYDPRRLDKTMRLLIKRFLTHGH